MSKETIKDERYNTIGYIETMSDGKQKAIDKSYNILGYYDPKRNITEDKSYRKIAQGNVLSALIFQKR